MAYPHIPTILESLFSSPGFLSSARLPHSAWSPLSLTWTGACIQTVSLGKPGLACFSHFMDHITELLGVPLLKAAAPCIFLVFKLFPAREQILYSDSPMARSQRTNILSFSLIMIVISCYLMKYLPVLVIIYYFAYLFSSLCFLSFFGISFFFSFLFIFILTLTHIRGYLKCVRTVQNAVWELLCKSGSW